MLWLVDLLVSGVSGGVCSKYIEKIIALWSAYRIQQLGLTLHRLELHCAIDKALDQVSGALTCDR